jgi:ABC-type transporter Mla subunit MlaD
MSTDERVLRLENAFATLEELAAKQDSRTSDLEKHFKMLTELAVRADERMDNLEATTSALGANVSALTQIVAEIAANQKRTDESLNRLASLVERHITEGHNGKP